MMLGLRRAAALFDSGGRAIVCFAEPFPGMPRSLKVLSLQIERRGLILVDRGEPLAGVPSDALFRMMVAPSTHLVVSSPWGIVELDRMSGRLAIALAGCRRG